MRKILNKRERRVAYIAAGAVIFSLLFNFSIVPLIKRHQSLNKEIDFLELRLRKYLMLLGEESGSGLALLEKSAPDSLTEVQLLGDKAGIRIIEISQQGWKADKAYRERLILLRTQGNLEELTRFIYSINSSPFLLRIKKLDIEAEPLEDLLEARVTIAEAA